MRPDRSGLPATTACHALRVAYQGIAGAFGEAAVEQHWGGGARPVAARTFDDALTLLTHGDADRAVIPVWNSSIGDVPWGCEALGDHSATVEAVDHVDLSVQHCLLALDRTTLDDVRFVGSHPAALAQCRRFFERYDRFVACSASDTAGAARELARRQVATDGAEPWYAGTGADSPSALAVLASISAARRYSLSVLIESVQDDPANITRFAVVRRR